jgi:hypothetical protein
MYLFVDLTVCGIALAVHRWYVLLLLVIKGGSLESGSRFRVFSEK